MTVSRKSLPLVISLLVLLLGACKPTPPRGEDRGEKLFATCAACHGDQGQGIQLAGAPAIAGLDKWYLEAQISKFMSGARGAHPHDVEGLRMRPMSLTLENEGDPEAVVDYIAALPAVDPAPTLEGGRPEKGESLYATCSACHGPDATGMKAQNAPTLLHSNDWYLLTQLKKFKGAVRGGDPNQDPVGNQMVAMAGTLADEQAMKDVLAYIETLSKK